MENLEVKDIMVNIQTKEVWFKNTLRDELYLTKVSEVLSGGSANLYRSNSQQEIGAPWTLAERLEDGTHYGKQNTKNKIGYKLSWIQWGDTIRHKKLGWSVKVQSFETITGNCSGFRIGGKFYIMDEFEPIEVWTK